MRKILHKSYLSALLVGLIFTSFDSKAQFPESFETAVPPAGWAAFNNGIGLAQEWTTSATAYTGAQAAFVRYENVTGIAEDWLVTPQFTVGANNTLEFYQRQSFTSDFGSIYTVRVSTVDQTTTTSFNTVDTQTELDFTNTYDVHYVDLSAYAGQAIYVAFVMTNDDGDNWFIDDVNMVSPPCVAPINLNAANITVNSADLSWAPFTTGTDFEYSVLPNGSPAPTSGTGIIGTSYNATGLNQASVYDLYVREVCAGTDPLIISGVFDGPLIGGTPKGVELYVVKDIADLSIYGISSANNGGGPTGTPEFSFPAGAYTAGSYIYVASDSAGFFNYYGIQATYVATTAMNVNGDDAIELFMNGGVIDVFGDVNVDGTGQPWEYLDGWAYRNSGSYTNGGVFDNSEWSYSGINATDGATTNATATSQQPLGTFITSEDVSPWSTISFQTLCGPFAGDSISDPIVIGTMPYSDNGNTSICYTDQGFNASADAFYMYVVDDACMESLDISLCGSGYDTYLRILDTLGNPLDINDDACGTGSEILGFTVSLGDTIIIMVEGFSANTGDYVLNITPNYTTAVPVLLSQTDVTCGGQSTGEATFSTGDPTATYQWDANTGGQTDSVAINLAAGTYYVTVTYSSGCIFNDSVTILELNPAITVNPLTTAVLCNGGSDGSVVLNEAGGSGTLTTDWMGENPTALGAGTFTYTVTDGAGCSYAGSVVINEPTAITLSATATDETAGNDGTIDLTVSGGTSPYTYTWTGGAGNMEDPAGLTGNTSYTVTVTDDNGCTDTLSVYVGSVVSLNEISAFANMEVYPNPNNGQFTVVFGEATNVTMEAFNGLGQQVASMELISLENNVDLSAMEKGTYTLRFTNVEGVSTYARIVLF